MSQTTAYLLSRGNEWKNDVLQKSFMIFVWHNLSREHFKILQGNMRTKDNFMREKGTRNPPLYDPHISLTVSLTGQIYDKAEKQKQCRVCSIYAVAVEQINFIVPFIIQLHRIDHREPVYSFLLTAFYLLGAA